MIEWLTPPPFKIPIKTQTKKRWSEIVPVNPILRVMFRILRAAFGETGVVSGFTRLWPCQWRMTVLSTGATATSYSRQFLIFLEHELFFKTNEQRIKQ